MLSEIYFSAYFLYLPSLKTVHLLQRQVGRLRQALHTCGDTVVTSRLPFLRSFYEPFHHLAFCPVYKVGTARLNGPKELRGKWSMKNLLKLSIILNK